MMDCHRQPFLSRVVLAGAMILAAVFAGCGKSEEELMAVGEASAEHQQWGDALRAYREVVERFPGGASAPEALYKIGTIQYATLQDFAGAAQKFDEVVARFPASAAAPKALMVEGFLFAEEPSVRDLEKARACYERLIRDYPQHELVRGARLELEHLGQPTHEAWEEIVNGGHAAGDSLTRAPSARALAH